MVLLDCIVCNLVGVRKVYQLRLFFYCITAVWVWGEYTGELSS